MKTINNFFDKTSLWIVYPVMAISMAIFVFFIFRLMSIGLETPFLPTVPLIKVSLILGAIMGLLFTLTTSMTRRSTKFWNAAEVLEEKIDEERTRVGLKELFDKDFQELRNLANGGAHITELTKLNAIMQTKFKLLPE